MKLLDLFSGIGGFSLAARWTGRIKTIGFCETDPYCRKVLEKNFTGVPIHGDIRQLKGADVGPADIISGGFPCQPFSVSGKRGGTEDDRYLWPEMLRVVSDIRPAWVVGENVDGLVLMGVRFGVPEVASRKYQRTEEFDYLRRVFTRQETMLLFSILEDLEALGYGAVPLVIPACGVDAPHLRYRVWIVGYADRTGRDTRKSSATTMGHGDSVVATGSDVADAEVGTIGAGLRPVEPGRIGRGRFGNGGGEDVPDADGKRGCGRGAEREYAADVGELSRGAGARTWLPEPSICRVDDGLPQGLYRHQWPAEWSGVPRVAQGVPNRVDRLRALGNAIVPQVAYRIFEAILAVQEIPI